MKKLLALWIALITWTVAHAADALPVFNATLTVGKESRFVLIGPDGKASSWLAVGDTFAGYKIKSFDSKSNALELEKDGKVTRVTLAADAAVANGPGMAARTKATLADAEEVLSKMNFEKMIEKTFATQKAAMGRMVQQMGGGNIPPEHREDFVKFQQKMMDELLSALNPSQMKDDMAQIFSDVFTKEELDGLSAFYSTPVGAALNDKQPEVQQRLQEAMMPRMMAVMPKIQQMSREFATEMKAKAAAKAAATPAPAPAPSAPAGKP